MMEALISCFIMGVLISTYLGASGSLEKAKRICTMESLSILALNNMFERLEAERGVPPKRVTVELYFHEECARQGLSEANGALPLAADSPGGVCLSVKSKSGRLLAEVRLKCSE